MVAKYLVYAGCSNEGQVLQGQPYDGPLDSASVAAFALSWLRRSPYHSSNTAWGLESLDWDGLDDQGCDDTDDAPIYFVYDDDTECRDDDCPEGGCDCERDEYFVCVTRNTEG